MSQSCTIPTCKLKSSILCYCCNKYICVNHLKEHQELNKSELNVLNNEILILNDQLKTFDIKNLIKISRDKLDIWKDDCHQMINLYYEQKCQELEQFSREKVDQHQNKINQIEITINDFIRNEKVTQKVLRSFQSSISDLKREINKLKEKGIQMDIRPFILDNHTISIRDSKPNAFNINTATFLSPYRTIECHDGWQTEMVSNDRFILIHLGEYLCLFDRDLIIIKQSPWISECIYDMCWSSTLSNFIVITNKKKVYRINENTLAIDRVYGIEEKEWLSCTCSDTCLYLTTTEIPTNIYQFKLLPLIRLVKQWISPHSCKAHQSIHDIQYNDGTIALIIRQSFAGVLDMELRSSATLNRLWSLPLDIRTDGLWSRIISRSLQYDEWLIVHATTSRLFHISKEGKLKIIHQYLPKLQNATMFGSNTLVIHLGSKVNFHKLKQDNNYI